MYLIHVHIFCVCVQFDVMCVCVMCDVCAGVTGGYVLQPHHSIETADSESLSSYDRDSIHSTSTTGQHHHIIPYLEAYTMHSQRLVS